MNTGDIKIKRKWHLVACTALVAMTLSACSMEMDNREGYFEKGQHFTITNGDFTIKDGTFKAKLNDSNLQIVFTSGTTARMTYLTKDDQPEDSLVIAPSLSIKESFNYLIEGQIATLDTGDLKVKVDLKAQTLSFIDNAGKTFMTEAIAGPYRADVLKLKVGTSDRFYGASAAGATEGVKDKLLRHNKVEVSASKQGHGGAPFIWSTSGYGVLIDSKGGTFNLSSGQIRYDQKSAGGKDYFVMVGRPAQIFKDLSVISGQTPMSPKWALGFHYSELGLDELKLKQKVAIFRANGLMLDNIGLDLDWKAWGDDHYGDWSWQNERFPNGSTGVLAKDLSAMGVHLTGVMKPKIHVASEQGDYATNHQFWWPKTLPMLDFYTKKLVNGLNFNLKDVRSWYYDKNRNMYRTGFAGYWNDEADNGYDNFQNMNMQRAMYEGLRKDTADRVWSINRSYYLGAQRYGYGMWSGNIDGSFEAMKSERQKLLSAAAIGQFKWGMDTGGILGPNPSPENYARWMQFSAMTPIFRAHGNAEHDRSPWAFGDKAENAVKKAMEMRSAFVPYMYSYEYALNQTGVGLVRPLAFMYPSDANVANYVDGWMLGDYIYVAPVVDKGQTRKKIYLPEGEWVRYGNAKTIKGGSNITIKTDSVNWSDIPMFIRAGAIIPTQDPQRFEGEKINTEIYLNVFPNMTKSSFVWYDDDGKTYDYEKGNFTLQKITQEKRGSKLDIDISKPEGKYKSQTTTFVVRIRNYTIRSADIAGRKLTIVNGTDQMGNFSEVMVPSGEALKLSIGL